MSTQTLESVQVSIFNQTYNLRSHASGSEPVRRIAQLVDERMRHISSHLTTHDVAKVAILAALNIADELQRMRDLQGEDSDGSEGKRVSDGGSWFDDIFDSAEPARERGGRLSSQVSARLQEHRRSRVEASTADESSED
jgi:cell division protein ZapA (FtsZ GTPase activity inhibitor)